MVSNPHKAIVLKMSVVSAYNLFMFLGFAERYISLLREPHTSIYESEIQSWMEQARSAFNHYDGSKQIVHDVRLPVRPSCL